ncbi:Xaa-Pro peptidase family protein [Stappia sp. ES.058]|uniref:M24 family metallopeptidase n=1 Tax=Stappia sp. ES.058 TaxID=1881061 RepID=UPI00087CA375|nr:Xaa-Pro peptidase family protein [Stappia sp. ES.058]SDU18035.1 Xaa-Pro aminopeptidase [Stappia sp. ES.058]
MSGEGRGFPVTEYRARVARAQVAMADAGLDALLLTSEPDVRYFSGFLTRFWESPTRPWFLVVPAGGDPVAVIPSIGASLMAQTWIEDVRSWRSPDLEDDGVSLLAEALREVAGVNRRLGLPMGAESSLRMPLADFKRLEAALSPVTFVGDAGIMRALRIRKSPAEVEKIRKACEVADRAFARVGEIAGAGARLDDVARRFQMLCLEEGADWVPYLACPCGPGGYHDVISPADGHVFAPGDVLMLDTGLVHDGYFCDFDRNFAIGAPSQAVRAAHRKLLDAVDAAMDIARPGVTAADLFHAMDKIVTGGQGGSDTGRLGHGLGTQLTEWPSLIPQDRTRIATGMALTLEPGIEVEPGRILVHEENIVIGDHGAEFLSTRADPEILCLEARR